MVWCLSKSYAHTNNCKKRVGKKKKEKNKKKTQHRLGINVRVQGLMSDCWLEVSLHPEVFPWFPLFPEQMLSW
jgi:hypothetical protein